MGGRQSQAEPTPLGTAGRSWGCHVPSNCTHPGEGTAIMGAMDITRGTASRAGVVRRSAMIQHAQLHAHYQQGVRNQAVWRLSKSR